MQFFLHGEWVFGFVVYTDWLLWPVFFFFLTYARQLFAMPRNGWYVWLLKVYIAINVNVL